MDEFLIGVATFLLANLVLGLLRLRRGPAPADRLLALLLFGTITVAIVLLLAHAQHVPALSTVALLIAVLAAIAAIAFTQMPRSIRGDSRT